MPDIFGREPDQYRFASQVREAGQWDAYQRQTQAWHPYAHPEHRFDGVLGAGVPKAYERATQNAQALGFITDNLLSLQTMVDEVLYTAYRLPRFVHINTNIPEGAGSYGVRVSDRVGKAARVTSPGQEAPTATVSRDLETQRLDLYGIDAEWSLDELRGAMYTGVPLDTESIDAAVMGAMETMESVGLTGGDYGDRGLLNLDAAASPSDDQVHLKTQGDNATFSDLTAIEIRDVINTELTQVIEQSKETLGRNINTGMTIYLPGKQYDELAVRYIGDNAEKTIMKSVKEDNPWTHFTNGSPVMIERVLELDGRGASSTDRMVVALKHSRVAEMGVSIMPRVIRTLDKGRVICAQVECKFSTLFVKRPSTIRYVDGI